MNITIDRKITKKHLESKGFKVSQWASEMMDKLEWNNQGTYEVVIKTVSELGLTNGGTLKEIYAKAKEQGLELCPPEMGPAFRLAYKDHPRYEWVRIAMEPITDSFGSLEVFYVGTDDVDRWLFSRCGFPDGFWDGGGQWLFVRPRNVSLPSDPQSSLDPLNLDRRLKILEEKFDKLRNL